MPALSDEKIRVQKDVVKNEYRQNYENRPYGQVGRILSEAMYGPDHPYSWLTIGAMEDVERASREDIEAFFKRYYVPSNASLAIVGDIDKAAVKALVEKYFGPFKKGGVVPKPSAETPKITAERRVVVKDRVELPKVDMAWITPPFLPMA